MSKTLGLDLSETLAGVVETHGPSVVRVHGRRAPTSGILWSSDGQVAIAAHTLEREDDLSVTLHDGRTLKARLIGRDAGTDLALLALEPPDGTKLEGLTTPQFIDPSGAKVGHLALTLSRPSRATRAQLSMVSAVGEAWRTSNGGRIEQYLELGLGIFPGFSGSLVVNLAGQALGLATAGPIRGTAVVVPAATLTRVMQTLQSSGKMKRGFLGVSTYPVRVPPAQAQALGHTTALLVVGVQPGSPAEAGGLLLGDALLSLDGQPLHHAQELLALLDEEKVGTEVTLRLVRAGSPLELRCRIGTREERS